MSDTAARLARLRARLAATTDPDDRADLAAAIAALEREAGVASSSPPPTSVTNDQRIGGNAQVGVAVAGSISGDVTVFFTAAGIDPSEEQRELVASYLNRLAQRCDRLRVTGAVRRERRDAGATLTLSDVYTTLAAESWETVREAHDARIFAADLEAGDPDTALPDRSRRLVELQRDIEPVALPKRGDAQSRFRLERPLLLTEALCRRKRVVLLGGPGSGKSTFLRYLAVALARCPANQAPDLPGWSAGRLLPLYASLGAFAAWARQPGGSLDGPGLWRYLLATAQEYGLEGLDRPLKRAFRNGGLLLLLDGLDEVADPATRTAVAQAVAALAETGGMLAVTCRVRSFDAAVASPFHSWGTPVTLAPFTLGQMRHFVAAWYDRSADRQAIDPDEARQRTAELTERLAQLPGLRDLAQTPLLLTIITILHYYEGKLPEDRADLYEDLVQLLLTRWTQQRREAGAPPALLDQLKADGRLGGLKEYHLRNTLEELAYRAHQEPPASDGRGLLSRHLVQGAFQDLFAAFELGPGPAAEKAALVLDYMEHESGLLLSEGGDRYGLPHLSYEEYLAACYLARQSPFALLPYQHWQGDPGRWREVIFLALGRMVRGEGREAAAAWLHYLVLPAHGERERAATERQQAAFFAGECLEQMGGKPALIGVTTVDLADLWQRMAWDLAGVVEGTTLPASDRVRASIWLGELGDPRPGVCTLPPAMVEFPGGLFTIGEPTGKLGYGHEENDQPSTIAPFAIARYPVTNAQYALFLDDDGYHADAPWWDAAGREWLRQSGRTAPLLWNDERFGITRPNHPVVGVTWYEATAFCRWLTQHPAYNSDGFEYLLPSELEWEYAARGTTRRTYAWGDEEPDGERANFNGIYNGTTAVGCFAHGATPEGVYDLTGNMLEWTRSKYRPYPYDPNDGREDGAEPTRKYFTLRGGSWADHPIYLRAANRSLSNSDSHGNGVGFRLARHPPRVRA